MDFINQAIKALILALCCICLSSCVDQELRAERSLEGRWKVTEIFSRYTTFTSTGYGPDLTLTEAGELGYFVFGDENVEYSFTRNDTLFSGNAIWDLTSEKVRTGFVRETIFKLEIEEEFLFEVTFDSGANLSKKDAKNAVFANEPVTAESGLFIALTLEKE